MKTQRLTMAQALVKHLAALRIERSLPNGERVIEPYCGGVFTIFGHGNVAGLGEALAGESQRLPTFRAHNEQSMAHAAIAYSKSLFANAYWRCPPALDLAPPIWSPRRRWHTLTAYPYCCYPATPFQRGAPTPSYNRSKILHKATPAPTIALDPSHATSIA